MKFSMLNHLALVMSLILSGQTYALEMLEDDSLSDVTGEGVAFLPESFAMVFRGANAATLDPGTGKYIDPAASLLTDRSKDTGYIRYIPVGPLTATATAAGAGKGDLFLYGLAVSRGDSDFNSRLNATDPLITAWGTSDNPWLFKVQTQPSVPDFTSAAPTDTSTGSVTYLSLEAPLYHKTLPATRATGQDAYDLKLAMWADAFVRRSDVAENMSATGTQFDVGGAGRANRLRLQAVWDGFSINGSEVRLFQTLAGATNTGGLSTFYNNTLGLTGLLRFNSGATDTLRATFVQGTANRSQTTNMRYTTTNILRPGGAPAVDTLYRLQSVDTIDTVTSSSWTLPTLSSALRFSTQETGTVQGLLETSAINGTSAPTFNATEGLYFYNPNINLVLGQLYQPLVVGVAPDGRNLMLEVARIPNKELIYKKIYTNYDDSDSVTNGGYFGSTCNVHRCGPDRGLSGVNYQGNTATHSSISLGSTEWSGTASTTSFNLLTAHKGEGAVGVSFGTMASASTPASTNYYYQLQQQSRARQSNTRWRYNGTTNGTNNCVEASGACYQFDLVAWVNTASFDQAALAPLYNPTVNHVAQNVTGQANPVVPAWNALPGASYAGTTWTSTIAPVAAPVASAIPIASNNLGSAVIDGLLIQHLKITTKGL